MHRRALLATSAVLAATLARREARADIPVQHEGTTAERSAMEAEATAFMRRYDVPGLSVAIARQGRMVYQEAFGLADQDSGERLTPVHRFRIASLSKPFTATAIFTLIEQGRVRLSDRVFGPGAILGVAFGAPPYSPFIDQITVEHLLTHTAGGWQNDGHDPMFQEIGLDHARLIAWTLRNQPLTRPPGTAFAYSNFGYCVLGRIIEKLTGQPYDAFVREAILDRCDIRSMRIAGNTRRERTSNEVAYFSPSRDDPYRMNVRRMDSHGGWIADASDLVRFLVHVDGFTTTPNILRPETIRIMTTPSSVGRGYAAGWAVNQRGNYWHNGSLPGSVTIMVRTSGGFCWAGLTNTRQPDQGGALDRLMWTMVGKVSSWKA